MEVLQNYKYKYKLATTICCAEKFYLIGGQADTQKLIQMHMLEVMHMVGPSVLTLLTNITMVKDHSGVKEFKVRVVLLEWHWT